MVAYSFKSRFREPIRYGIKQQTIRNERKRHARPGEYIQLYTGMRTKQCRLIGRATCILVELVSIRVVAMTRKPCEIETPSLGRLYKPSALDDFARLDGFDDWAAMRAFWLLEHAIEVFTGVRLVWAEFRS